MAMSDPTDPGGVGAAQAERTSRTTTRAGDGGSPVGPPVTIVLSVIAVVVGFLIFRSIDGGGTSAGDLPVGGNTPVETTTTLGETPPAGGAVVTDPPVQTDVRTGAQVIVINAARVSGAAGDIDALLKAKGYSTDAPVTNADQAQNPTTVVYYTEGTQGDIARQVAETLGRDLGGASVQAGTASQFTLSSGDTIPSATVFVFLGTDKASITTLAPETPAMPDLPTTTAAPA